MYHLTSVLSSLSSLVPSNLVPSYIKSTFLA